MKNLGCDLKPGQLKIDYMNKKDMKEKIEAQFEKIDEEEDEDEDFKDDEPSFDFNRKHIDVPAIEEEFKSFTNMSLVLRRGRCNKIFAKYVEKCVFEDSDSSDIDDEDAMDKKTMLKKRRKKYGNIVDYL
jgi:hypothetical protein